MRPVFGALGAVIGILAGGSALPAWQANPFADVYAASSLDVRPRILAKRVPDSTAVPGGTRAGVLRLEFVIEQDGRVQYVRPAGDAGALTGYVPTAVDLLRRWTFSPGVRDTQAVRSLASVIITFRELTTGRGAAVPRMTQSWAVEGADDVFGVGAERAPAPGLSRPQVLREAKPRYPGAVRDRATGDVELEIVIAPDGRVSEARVVRSFDARFDLAAVESARQWLFKPAMRAGTPVAVIVPLVLTFRR